MAGPRRGRAKCGVLLGLPSPSRIPLGGRGMQGRERERERERGAAPPPLVQFGLLKGEGATSWAAALSLPSGPLRPNTCWKYALEAIIN